MKELALYNLKEGMVLEKTSLPPADRWFLKRKELTKQSILRLSFL